MYCTGKENEQRRKRGFLRRFFRRRLIVFRPVMTGASHGTERTAAASFLVGWCVGVVGVLVTVGGFAALWYASVTAPDDRVREICVGSETAPDWYLAEHHVAGKAYYTLRSGRGNTPWDERFGARPGSWLFLLRGESGSEPNELLLQRVDGSVWRVHLLTGEVEEAPAPALPMIPMGALFADGNE